MTVHWINEENGRSSAVMACRRFKGCHTHDRIAEMICEIHDEYDLPVAKIVCTVTDNASNFKKAFSTFPAPSGPGGPSPSSESEGESDDDDEEVELMDVDAILTRASCESESDNDFTDLYVPVLPPHHKCAAHTLNLVGKTDAEKITQGPYFKLHNSAFGKCQALWNSVGRSTKAADAIREISPSKSLVIPNVTRWNSTFDAVHCLLGMEEKLPAICDAVNVVRFKACDLELLREYETVMKPLAETLDMLQGENTCYLGHLLPKLCQLRHKLNTIQERGMLIHAGPLLANISSSVSHRFGDFLNLKTEDESVKTAVVAAVSHPRYKLQWVVPEMRQTVSETFCQIVFQCSASSAAPHGGVTMELDSSCTEEDEYGYVPSPSLSTNKVQHVENRIKAEALMFLEDR
jgi:hypothetical protein